MKGPGLELIQRKRKSRKTVFRETLADRVYPAGNYSLNFNGSALPSGSYFARLQGAQASIARRIVLLR